MENKTPQKRYWFHAKTYGWGWTPATWEGWLVLVIFIGIMFWNVYRLEIQGLDESDTLLRFFIENGILVFFLIWICYKKGEKPGWRWGNKK